MFLKNKNIIFKIRRSKVTDYAALRVYSHPEVYCQCVERQESLQIFKFIAYSRQVNAVVAGPAGPVSARPLFWPSMHSAVSLFSFQLILLCAYL